MTSIPKHVNVCRTVYCKVISISYMCFTHYSGAFSIGTTVRKKTSKQNKRLDIISLAKGIYIYININIYKRM